MNYHAIIGTKWNMQGEKSTCLPCQTADSLPRILVVDFPQTACVYTITSKTYNKIKTTHKTVKTEEDKVIKMFHALQGSRERKNR